MDDVSIPNNQQKLKYKRKQIKWSSTDIPWHNDAPHYIKNKSGTISKT